MPSGIGAAGFGGGIARGLANVLMTSRQDRQKQENADADRKLQLLIAALPVFFENAVDVADLEPLLSHAAPDFFPPKKGKGPSAFESVAPLLAPLLQQPRATATSQMTGPQPPATSTPPTPVPPTGELPGRPAVAPGTPAPAASQRTLGGVPMLSETQKITRDVTRQSTMSEALMQRAKAVILPAMQSIDPNATIYDALRVLGVNFPQQTTTPFQSVPGQLPDGKEAFGAFDQSRGVYLDPNTRQPLVGFRPRDAAGQTQFGVDREALSRATFGKPFGQLDQNQASIILREEKRLLEEESKSRGAGTATARFNAPADLATAQQTGVQVGTSAADVAGQRVPTTQQTDRRRSIEDLRTQLTEIKDTLLGPLPKQDELGGLIPGAVYALRRRSPQYREAIARLESRINSVVNVMARAVGEQRGTQTERDALRAEAAIAQIRDAVFTGDTQESATARIEESLRTLDQILSSVPALPVPGAGTNPAGGSPPASSTGGGGAAPAGAVIRDGQLYINGQLIGQP